MKYEIEMLSVGAADAILIRYFGEDDKEIVILIDAGYKKDGKKIVDHINKWTNKKEIDLAICTHPDNDHIGGFFYIVKHTPIKMFWIHDPKIHIAKLKALRESINEGDEIKKSLDNVFENLNHAKSLLTELDNRGIKREEPLVGKTYELAPLTVLGPEIDYYTSKLNNFRDVNILLEGDALLEKALGNLTLGGLFSDKEMLDQKDDVSAENNSSLIMLFTPAQKKYLFTSDVGPEALNPVVEDNDLSNIYWLDLPHHGSRFNFSTELIERLNPKIAYVSCDGSDNWPSMALVRLLKANGTLVYSTQNGKKLHRRGTPCRLGYSKANPL